MQIKQFEDLPVWKLSLVATKKIYDISAKERFSKDFWLRDQIRRSVVSISSNIVEWYEKNNNNEFVRFLRIAKWSCGEARNQLYISLTIDYINQEEFDAINEILLSLSKQISWLIKYLEQFKKVKQKEK